jgi:hypothetical protein
VAQAGASAGGALGSSAPFNLKPLLQLIGRPSTPSAPVKWVPTMGLKFVHFNTSVALGDSSHLLVFCAGCLTLFDKQAWLHHCSVLNAHPAAARLSPCNREASAIHLVASRAFPDAGALEICEHHICSELQLSPDRVGAIRGAVKVFNDALLACPSPPTLGNVAALSDDSSMFLPSLVTNTHLIANSQADDWAYCPGCLAFIRQQHIAVHKSFVDLLGARANKVFPCSSARMMLVPGDNQTAAATLDGMVQRARLLPKSPHDTAAVSQIPRMNQYIMTMSTQLLTLRKLFASCQSTNLRDLLLTEPVQAVPQSSSRMVDAHMQFVSQVNGASSLPTNKYGFMFCMSCMRPFSPADLLLHIQSARHVQGGDTGIIPCSRPELHVRVMPNVDGCKTGDLALTPTAVNAMSEHLVNGFFGSWVTHRGHGDISKAEFVSCRRQALVRLASEIVPVADGLESYAEFEKVVADVFASDRTQLVSVAYLVAPKPATSAAASSSSSSPVDLYTCGYCHAMQPAAQHKLHAIYQRFLNNWFPAIKHDRVSCHFSPFAIGGFPTRHLTCTLQSALLDILGTGVHEAAARDAALSHRMSGSSELRDIFGASFAMNPQADEARFLMELTDWIMTLVDSESRPPTTNTAFAAHHERIVSATQQWFTYSNYFLQRESVAGVHANVRQMLLRSGVVARRTSSALKTHRNQAHRIMYFACHKSNYRAWLMSCDPHSPLAPLCLSDDCWIPVAHDSLDGLSGVDNPRHFRDVLYSLALYDWTLSDDVQQQPGRLERFEPLRESLLLAGWRKTDPEEEEQVAVPVPVVTEDNSVKDELLPQSVQPLPTIRRSDRQTSKVVSYKSMHSGKPDSNVLSQ